jgi:hypothetical protein
LTGSSVHVRSEKRRISCAADAPQSRISKFFEDGEKKELILSIYMEFRKAERNSWDSRGI